MLATAQRLKSGLKLDDLRLSETTQDGIQIYVPIGNFGRFSSEGLTVARVATTDIKCNHNDIIALWLDQSKRKDWDSSCISVLPVKASATDEANAKASQLSHFVEKSIIGVPLLIPSRDYVIEVLQPYPGESSTSSSLSSSSILRSAAEDIKSLSLLSDGSFS